MDYLKVDMHEDESKALDEMEQRYGGYLEMDGYFYVPIEMAARWRDDQLKKITGLMRPQGACMLHVTDCHYDLPDFVMAKRGRQVEAAMRHDPKVITGILRKVRQHGCQYEVGLQPKDDKDITWLALEDIDSISIKGDDPYRIFNRGNTMVVGGTNITFDLCDRNDPQRDPLLFHNFDDDRFLTYLHVKDESQDYEFSGSLFYQPDIEQLVIALLKAQAGILDETYESDDKDDQDIMFTVHHEANMDILYKRYSTKGEKLSTGMLELSAADTDGFLKLIVAANAVDVEQLRHLSIHNLLDPGCDQVAGFSYENDKLKAINARFTDGVFTVTIHDDYRKKNETVTIEVTAAMDIRKLECTAEIYKHRFYIRYFYSEAVRYIRRHIDEIRQFNRSDAVDRRPEEDLGMFDTVKIIDDGRLATVIGLDGDKVELELDKAKDRKHSFDDMIVSMTYQQLRKVERNNTDNTYAAEYDRLQKVAAKANQVKKEDSRYLETLDKLQHKIFDHLSRADLALLIIKAGSVQAKMSYAERFYQLSRQDDASAPDADGYGYRMTMDKFIALLGRLILGRNPQYTKDDIDKYVTQNDRYIRDMFKEAHWAYGDGDDECYTQTTMDIIKQIRAY